MLFDLQGKRRRTVQVSFLLLAVIFVVGFVGAGIGGDVQGGIFDAFKGGNGGSSSGNSLIEKRVKANEKKVKANPRSAALRKTLTRDYYQLAVAGGSADGTFSADAKADLRKAAASWQAYRALEPAKPDVSLARLALQIYDPAALNRTEEAKNTAQLIASRENNAPAYLALVQYATLDSDTRTADLAGQKALDLAPKAQQKQVRAQIKQLKMPPAAGQGQGAAPSQ